MHDKPWKLFDEMDRLIAYYKATFGDKWLAVFQATVRVSPDAKY